MSDKKWTTRRSIFDMSVLDESTWNDDAREWTHSCGSIVMAAKVYHPIWFKEFTCAGGGDVRIETVPYCPTCEPKPSDQGAPIYV